MLVFKTEEFARFARREGISDAKLRDATERAALGLVDADLGGGLIKQRVARQGECGRGGYRTLMAFRDRRQTVFLYGFAKSERDNIGLGELDFWRRVARGYLETGAAQWQTMIAVREVIEVGDG